MQNMPMLLITSRDKNSSDSQKDKIQNQTSLHNVKKQEWHAAAQRAAKCTNSGFFVKNPFQRSYNHLRLNACQAEEIVVVAALVAEE